MAAATLSTTWRESIGDLTLTIATFSNINNTNTWASNIQGVIGYWGNCTDDPTQTKEGIDITLTTASTGEFTFQTGENSRVGMIYVLSSS